MMKVLITGGNSQLAGELVQRIPADIQCVSLSKKELDISDAAAVNEVFAIQQPHAVINTAAYTQVDLAEQNAELAKAVNTQGVENLFSACGTKIYLLHISTDFVFSGSSSSPYLTDDERQPLSEYGKTKADGESALIAASTKNWAIIRTSWLYANRGNNFVNTMLRLMNEKDYLRVVSDQVGSPTWAAGLADICWHVVRKQLKGIYHYSDAGVASWYDFAQSLQNAALRLGLLTRAIPISPISTAEYPTPAQRPSYSVLDTSALFRALPECKPIHWQKQLEAMLKQKYSDSD